MKRIFISSVIMAMILGFSMQAHADLELLGQGTSTHGTYNLIYDTDLNITWYDYSSSMKTWQNQVNWADALTVDVGGTDFDDWRLPIMFDESCSGFNCTTGEMGHLYYTELGNTTGGGLINTGDFQTLKKYYYWSGTAFTANPGNSWYSDLTNGYQDGGGTNNSVYGLAVHEGMVGTPPVVPEPISSILFLVGGATLGFRRMRNKFKK